MSRTRVLTLLDTLRTAGAETVAVSIAAALRDDPEFEPLVCASREGGPLEERLRHSGVEYRILHRRSTADVRPFLDLRRWIRERGVGLIHGHMMGSNLWAGLLSRSCRIPAIAHAHGQPRGSRDALLNALIARLARRVVAVSRSERELILTQSRIDPDRVITVHNGIAARTPARSDPQVRGELGIAPGVPVVGICAHLREEKGHDVFLRAAARVIEEIPDAVFLLVGDGERRSSLEALAEELGVRAQVVFAGERSDVSRLLASFDVAVLSSTREGLPLSLLEYMASGLPIVATRVGGIPEAVEEGGNGLLVGAGDAKGMADALLRLLGDAALRDSFARRSREIFERDFSERAMLDRLRAVYREVLAESARAA